MKHTNAIAHATTSVFQTHFFIIGITYQRDDVRERDRQRDLFQNCYILRRAGRRANCRAGRRASYVALDVGPVVALLCRQSRDCRVCRRVTRCVPNRALLRSRYNIRRIFCASVALAYVTMTHQVVLMDFLPRWTPYRLGHTTHTSSVALRGVEMAHEWKGPVTRG